MIRKYEVLGAVLMAVLASGVIVKIATASPLTVPVGASPTHITTEQEGSTIFEAPGSGTVTCTTATSDTTVTPTEGQINEFTAAPTYSGCTAFGSSADVRVNGCTFTRTTATQVSAGIVTWGPAQLHLLCPAGKSIETTPTFLGASVCTQFIAAQTPTGGHITGRNTGGSGSGEMHLTFENTLSGLHYTGSGGVCGNSETHTNGTWTGNETARCYNNTAHTQKVDCTLS